MSWSRASVWLLELCRESLLAALISIAGVLVNALVRLLSGDARRDSGIGRDYEPDW